MSFFREMRIQNKLLCSTGISLISIAVVWFLILKIISASGTTFVNAEKMLEITDHVGGTAEALQRISEPITNVISSWNGIEARKEFDQHFSHFQKKLIALKKLLEHEQDESITNNIHTAEKMGRRIQEISAHVFELVEKKVTAESEGKMFASQAAIEQVGEAIVELTHTSVEALSALKKAEAALIQNTHLIFEASLEENKRFSFLSIVTLITGVLITSVVGFFIARSISIPVGKLREAVHNIAEGNFNDEISTHAYGEIGELAAGVSTMLEGLRRGDQRKAEMAKISAMIENAFDNFIFCDNTRTITYMNPASKNTLSKIESLLPCRVSEFLGKKVDFFVKDVQKLREIIEDPQSLPYTGEIGLGNEQIIFTASAIYDHNQIRIGTMANWSIVTEKNKMRSSLEETTSALAAASTKLEEASLEMRSTAEDTTRQATTVSSISDQTNQNVHSVASASEEMSVTISQIAKNMEQARTVSTDAVEKASLMNQMIEKLDRSSQAIDKVIKVITDIAEQTNLLALNATIEAARAGEAGKGFAVVANEVKDLAKGTASATLEISSQIRVIQENTKQAVDAIKEITRIIQYNNEIAVTIASAIEEQSQTTDSISQNMIEVAKGTEEMARDITGILSAAEGTATAADHIQGSSKNLAQIASRLSELLGDKTAS